MWLGGVPGLTLQPTLGDVHLALVKPAIALHTRGCIKENIFYNDVVLFQIYLWRDRISCQ